MAYVYKHTRKDTNEVFYIGIGKQSQRVYSTFGRNKYWKRIVDKVGFDYEIIEDNLTWEEACEKEKYWIKFYGRKNLNEGILVNMTDGGEGLIGQIFSEKHKVNLSSSLKGRDVGFGKGYSHSEEAKKKISNSNKGKHGYLFGLKHSEETKQKMSISKMGNKINVGRIHSEETKQKIREKRKLQVFSQESREKMSKSQIGNKNASKF